MCFFCLKILGQRRLNTKGTLQIYTVPLFSFHIFLIEFLDGDRLVEKPALRHAVTAFREYLRLFLEKEGRKPVLYDLYSGTGTIAQILAPVAKKVAGVEIVEEAV